MWTREKSVVIALLIPIWFCAPSTTKVSAQNLNVIPELLRSYVNEFPELQSLNILGNVSDILFSNGKNEANFQLGKYTFEKSYDFIIIGSGPAGCVLANRLSANPQWSVLLIEAGAPESIIQNIPLATSLSASSKYVRKYYFERDPGACLNIVDKECPFHSGVALGGSSVVNNFLYTRGNPADFDKWQEMGNEGWGYEDVLPYFKKVERRRRRIQFEKHQSQDEEDGVEGPLNIEPPRFRTGLLPVYLKAGQELGQNLIDYNDEEGTRIGIGIAEGTTLKGKRMSAAKAYIYPIYQDRPNLHILTNTQATKILIDEDTKKAIAVKYVSDGIESVVEVKKEVILSAGAIGSAHLLMLSGVGPRKILEKAKVPLIVDLPVGRKFHTNIAIQAPHFLINTTQQTLHIKRIGLKALLHFNSGNGPLTSFTGTEALSFIKTPLSKLDSQKPDVELQFVSAGIQSDLGIGLRKVAQIKDDIYEEVFKPIESPDVDSWSTIVTNLQSTVSGAMKLVDNDINTDPILKYPFFDDPNDLKRIVFGIKEAIRYAETRPFRMLGARLYTTPLPSCSHYKDQQDLYWDCYVRHVTTIVPQMVATNKMGPEDDPESVVDPQLRVRGIGNLRVADTSVVPTTISGHLQAISYMIGEKLSAQLKRDWRSFPNDIPEIEEEEDQRIDEEEQEVIVGEELPQEDDIDFREDPTEVPTEVPEDFVEENPEERTEDEDAEDEEIKQGTSE